MHALSRGQGRNEWAAYAAAFMPQLLNPEITERLRAGDRDAFTAVYDAYIRPIYRFIYYRTHHRQTAEDLTGQTFLKAWRHIRSFDPKKGSVGSWLYRIARNTVTDHYRGSGPLTVDIADVWDISDRQDVARDASVRLELERVGHQLAGLTPEQREIVLLRVWDGLSHREIAELLGKSEASCKMLFSRTLATLRRKLGPSAVAALLLTFI